MPESKKTDIVLLFLRLTVGGLMIVNHGWSKLMKFFSEEPIKFPDPLGIGETASLSLTVFAEVFCALLLVIGLFTRQVVIPLIITMLVAIFIIHWEDPFGRKEKAILFLIPYICLLIKGAGWYSLDAQVRKI